MRHTILTAAVALLAVTAGCGAVGTTNVGFGGEESGGRTVAVAASAQVEATPDRAVVSVAVTARGQTAEAAREELANESSRMRAALRDAGVNESQIVTTDYQIDSNPDPEPGESPFSGRHAFEITVQNPDRVGQIVVTAAENGATEIGGVTFTLSPETRRQIRREALAAAVDEARVKAAVAAKGTNLSLTGVRTVRTTGVSVKPVERNVAYAAARNTEATTTVESGPVSVSVRVVVVYNATSA